MTPGKGRPPSGQYVREVHVLRRPHYRLFWVSTLAAVLTAIAALFGLLRWWWFFLALVGIFLSLRPFSQPGHIERTIVREDDER